MAYAVCVRASVVETKCWRDNSFTGILRINGKDHQFKTRSTITKAVNARYTNVAWKPQEGSEILFDGEVFRDQVIVDHIERWNPAEYSELGRHDDLIKKLTDKLDSLPEMTKSWRIGRHDDEGCQITAIRWQKDIYLDAEQKKDALILNAICAEGEIRFAARMKTTGEVVSNKEAPILPLIAEILGIPNLQITTSEKKAEPAKAVKKGSSNPNKWIPGEPYRPIGMPEPEIEENFSGDFDPFDPFRDIPEDDPFSPVRKPLEIVDDEIPF